MLEHIDEDIVEQAIKKNVEKVDFVLLDWKGLGKYKQKVVNILDKIGIEVRRTKEFK